MYVGIVLYALYVIILATCWIYITKQIFVYMYKPYAMHFNKKNKNVKVIS